MRHYTMDEQGFELWFDSEATSLIEKYKVPGVALAVVRDSKDVYLKCLGVKCVDKNFPITSYCQELCMEKLGSDPFYFHSIDKFYSSNYFRYPFRMM